MGTRAASRPRQRQPELEHDHARSPRLGYEPPAEMGLVRCVSHGYPTSLARWHFHDEYEIHLITATSGRAFVGDWIGPFEPGHLVLTGPRLPHNWISTDLPEEGVAERDLVVQFGHAPIARAAELIPEMAELTALLERARLGVEFFDFGDRAQQHFHAVKSTRGMPRLTAFFAYLGELARWPDYRLLSSVQVQGEKDDDEADQVHAVVNRVARDFSQPWSASAIAAELGMSESRFSRAFRRATGNTFTDFVNRLRVHRACQLLMETDHRVTQICYDAGFHNLANFNRRFLAIKGVTPSEFRRQSDRRFGRSTG